MANTSPVEQLGNQVVLVQLVSLDILGWFVKARDLWLLFPPTLRMTKCEYRHDSPDPHFCLSHGPPHIDTLTTGNGDSPS